MATVALYPTYGADGTRLRDRSEAALVRLEGESRISVQRSRTGLIMAARFHVEVREPRLARLRPGTAYVFRESLDNTARVWTHKALPWRAVDAQLEHLASPTILEGHVKAIFQAVPLSCRKT